MASENDDELTASSAQLRLLTTVVTVILALTVAHQPIAEVVGGLRENLGPRALLDDFGRELTRLSPAIFYLCALWAIRGVFGELARRGQAFRPVLARGLRDVGWSLAWGAGMDVVGSPMLLRWLDGNRGPVANYIPAAIAVGVVGLALVLLSRLLERAAELRNELDQII